MKKSFVSFLLILLSFASSAQLERYKSIFIYKFAQNFEWPASKNMNTYKVGILGNATLYDELTQLSSGRTINGKTIEVVRFVPGDEVSNLCMLFISDADRGSFEVLSGKARENAVVIVTETGGMGKKGAPVNFVDSGGSLKFELNERSLNEYGVKASSSIKSLARLVN